MSTDFGWWNKDPEQGKYQVRAAIHGGNIEWTRKQGHHTSWLAHTPTEEDWDRLMLEAGNRVPRRLISPKQFEAIKRLREAGQRTLDSGNLPPNADRSDPSPQISKPGP